MMRLTCYVCRGEIWGPDVRLATVDGFEVALHLHCRIAEAEATGQGKLDP